MYAQQQHEEGSGERGEQPIAQQGGGGGVTLLGGGAGGTLRSLESEEAESSRANFTNFSGLCLAVSGTLPPASGLSSRCVCVCVCCDFDVCNNCSLKP